MAERARAWPGTAGMVAVLLALLPGSALALQTDVATLVGEPVASVKVEAYHPRLQPEASAAVSLRPGDRYSVEAVRESLQNLYALGSVADVEVLARESPDGLAVTFRLEPRILLTEIRLPDELPVGEGEARRALTVRPGSPLDAGAPERQARLLQQALADAGYLMAEVSAEIEPGQERGRGALVFAVEAGPRARLEGLTIEGDTGMPVEEIREILGLRQGDPFRPARLQEGLDELAEQLYERHYFYHELEILEQSLDLATAATTLVIAVRSGPRVDLVISGIDEEEHELHEELAIFEFDTVDDWALKESRHQLVQYLQEQRYWRPLVSYGRSRDEEGRNVQVEYRILSGDKHALEEILFEGNEAIRDDLLRSVIRTDTGGLFSGGKFIEQWWDQDREAVVAAYRRRGYMQAEVTEAPVGVESGDLVARMVIREGPQTTVRELRLELDTDSPTPGIDMERWREQLEIRAGGPYDLSGVRRDTDRLRGLLTNAGYPRGLVTAESLEVEGSPQSMIVVQRVEPRERVRVERILITGNEDTRVDVIRRELGLTAGSPWGFSAILESQSRLYRTGLFDRVEMEPALPDSAEPGRSMVVRVREAAPIVINYGAGFDTEERLRGLFGIGHENLLGRNLELNFSSRVSLREQRLRLLARDPRLLGRRLEGTATAFFSKEEEPSFDVERLGGSLTVLLRKREDLSYIARYSFRDVTTSNVEIDPALLDREDRSTRVGAIGGAVVHDSRPDPISPRSGTYQTLDVDVATPLLGSARSFATIFGRSFWYFGIGENLTLAAAGRAGLQVPFGGSGRVPLPERFFAGGSTTLRGFPIDEAGPVDSRGNPLGGEVLVIGNLETRLDLFGNFGAVAFFDWGNVFAEPGDVSVSGMREVLGVGGRYDTAVGPVRVDLGWLLDRQPREDSMQLYVSVGHTF